MQSTWHVVILEDKAAVCMQWISPGLACRLVTQAEGWSPRTPGPKMCRGP